MQQTTDSHKHKQGFSLIELLVVMAIIAILMGIVIGISGGVTSGAAEAQAKAQMSDLMMEFDKYKADKGSYPPSEPANSPRPPFVIGTGPGSFAEWYEDKYPDTVFTITEGSPEKLIDPWGNEYYYEYRLSNPHVYLLGTWGTDGRSGSKDVNTTFGEGDDITNRNGAL
ncbi:MAG: prepilin-type N-terminal cleavage/methylation domain-containing protein [Kiritimatiellia bacterium]